MNDLKKLLKKLTKDNKYYAEQIDNIAEIHVNDNDGATSNAATVEIAASTGITPGWLR